MNRCKDFGTIMHNKIYGKLQMPFCEWVIALTHFGAVMAQRYCTKPLLNINLLENRAT